MMQHGGAQREAAADVCRRRRHRRPPRLRGTARPGRRSAAGRGRAGAERVGGEAPQPFFLKNHDL